MNEPPSSYGTARERGPTVSYAEIERAARAVMLKGLRPTGKAVLEHLGRGSPNHIADSMQRFWKDQAALNAGDPLALSRLPPELADAAVAQWEQALRLSQQTAKYEDSQARVQLEHLRRETDVRVRSVELREKEWDIAARVRERALTDAREQVNLLMKELALDRAELRARDARIADLENQLEEHRRQLVTVIARAVSKNRARAAAKPRPPPRAKPKGRAAPRKKRPFVKRKPLNSKRKGHGKRR
ncbi:MAG: DNA-binding protein [Isosphaeraceae bacterium]